MCLKEVRKVVLFYLAYLELFSLICIIVHLCGLYISLNDFFKHNIGYFRGFLGNRHNHQTRVQNF